MLEKKGTLKVATDETLILEAQGGDMGAFEELVHRYDSKVLAMAVNFVGDADDAKDVYQEVFIRVYRALPRFQGKSSFSTWIYRIAINVCKTHLAKRARRRQVSIDEPIEGEEGGVALSEFLADSNTAEKRLLNSERGEHLLAAVRLLSPKQRLVFTLRHYHGFKLREIASMMKCAEGTVKRHLFSATQRMRSELKILTN